MNRKSLFVSVFALASVTTLLTAGHAAGPAFVTGGSHHREIIVQPGSQTALIGSDATFSVTPDYRWSYQWLHKGIPISSQTNSTLTIVNVQSDDAGFYTCNVDTGYEMVLSSEANLLAYTILDIDPVFVVFAQPIVSSGGSGSCPGAYKGYVNYGPTNTWGWVPATNTTIFTAADTNRTNTKVQYLGAYGDIGCGHTTVTIPYPLYSPEYGFTIYFTNNVPTTNYPILLTGFNPE